MTRILLFALLFFLAGRALMRLFMGIIDGATPRPQAEAGPPAKGETMVRDPVCGTFVVPSRAIALGVKGGIQHFCSEKCRDAWKAQ